MLDPENSIEEYIISLIEQHHSLDMAEDDFRKVLSSDHDFRAEYRHWCDEMGYTERHGFRDYAAEYLSQKDSVWDSLTDYDEDE